MNKTICFYCKKEFEYDGEQYRDVRCSFCQVENAIYPEKKDEVCDYCIDKFGYKPEAYCKICLENREEGEEMILGGKFLKVADCKAGDIITFLDGGVWEESRSFKNDDGTPKHQCQFQIKHAEEDKTITLNKTNREVLIAAWGRDTAKWIGKAAEITLKDVEVAGKDTTVIRLKAIQ